MILSEQIRMGGESRSEKSLRNDVIKTSHSDLNINDVLSRECRHGC